MKITPLSSTGTTVGSVSAGSPQAPQVQTTRSLRMATNATPGSYGQPDEDLSIGNNAEPTTTDAALEDEATKPLSPQLAALAKQKRALQVKERELQAREEALKSQPSTQEGGVTLADLKADPVGHFLKTGLNFDDLAQAVIAYNDGNPDLAAIEKRFEDLEKGFDKKLSDREAQSEQQALAAMGREAKALAASDPAFELINAMDGVKHVTALIERTYRKTGEVLDVREAMLAVEEELLADALKPAQLKKVQERLSPQPAPPQPQQRHMRTLTNRDTASVPLSPKARALAAFNGTLKR